MSVKHDPSSLLPLKPRVFALLLLLQRAPAHGYALIQGLEERGLRMDPGLLYRTIARLRELGVVAPTGPPADDRSRDARRKYYALTALGVEVVAAEAERQATLLRGLAGGVGGAP